ncbi:MAG TPA: hypothetical protein VF981_13285 [Gemmatimonadaceae bacterium]
MRAFQAPSGATWNVDVKLPSHSGAMLVFQHAGGQSMAGDRYAWINAGAAIVSDPRERLSATSLLESMSQAEIARLFRRSMAVSREG